MFKFTATGVTPGNNFSGPFVPCSLFNTREYWFNTNPVGPNPPVCNGNDATDLLGRYFAFFTPTLAEDHTIVTYLQDSSSGLLKPLVRGEFTVTIFPAAVHAKNTVVTGKDILHHSNVNSFFYPRTTIS